MAVIETKYSVGDTVWFASTTPEKKQHPCPDCKGERKWTAVSPAGGEYAIACPRCSARYMSDRDLSLDYTAHVATVSRMTIGSVRYDSNGGWQEKAPRHEYMCLETGVGSGSIYGEARLFSTEAEALTAAEVLASEANAKTKWIVELYNKTLEISDYQLEHAALKVATEKKSRAHSMLWNLRSLFETIAEAEGKDEILEAVEDYKRFGWERDKKSVATEEMADE